MTHRLVILIALAGTLLGSAARGDEPVFGVDVMAVLSKAGCNQGICHGNLYGKGGFKLSLRGQDPAFDFASLARDQGARRVNPLDPDNSLILLKPTMALPHEGGRRFDARSPEYAILRDWIARGMPTSTGNDARPTGLEVTPTEIILVEPAAEFPIQVTARFADGSTRDVSRLAVYEPVDPIVSIDREGLATRVTAGETTVNVRFLDRQVPVRVAVVDARPDFVWTGPEPANVVDEHVFAKLRAVRVNPSEPASDVVFLRRAYLDLLGLLPTGDEARRFAADADPDKRAKLIDELLDRPEFADAWALKWSDLLRNEERTLDRKGVQDFHAWIRRSIAEDKPLDQFTREIVAARGSTYTSPPANYYRALRDPVERAEATAQLFLGIRLQCAKCHNHPFDTWSQDDYYGWSSLFSGVRYKILENRRRDQNDKHEFDGEQIVYWESDPGVKNPRTGKREAPRFLGPGEYDAKSDRERLEQLAAWLTSPDNRRFVDTQVNRIWFQLLGRGIVDPIDDFRATNPPSNPELLAALGDEFVAQQFRLRPMLRLIMNSRTYQFDARPNDTNALDEINFSHTQVRRLGAEQLLDAFSQTLAAPVQFADYPVGLRAGQIPGALGTRIREGHPSSGDQFLRLFGKPARQQSCECERSDETTLSQAFQLVSGPFLNEQLSRESNRLAALIASGRSDAEIAEALSWDILSRAPSEEELSAAVKLLENAPDRRATLEDVAWGLLNSAEFMFRR